jgi:cytochrome c-type biogenesis protein CcmH/NrfF
MSGIQKIAQAARSLTQKVAWLRTSVRNLPPHILRSCLLVAVMTVAGFAQNGADLESAPVLRVGARLKCSCGCNQTTACQMPGGCAMCKTNRTKIYQMQHMGMNDQQIVDRFVAEKGPDVVVIPPGMGGIVGPYVALGMGLILVLYTIHRYKAKKPVVAGTVAGAAPGVIAADGIDPATLAQIEKEMDKFD